MKINHADFVSIKHSIHKNGNTENKTVSDVFKYIQPSCPIITIDKIVVDKNKRGSRFGAKVLFPMLEENEDKLIIIVLQYLDTDREEKSYKEKIESVIKLGKYFRKLGFVDVNQYFGRYSDRISMCYNNRSFQKLIENKK